MLNNDNNLFTTFPFYFLHVTFFFYILLQVTFSDIAGWFYINFFFYFLPFVVVTAIAGLCNWMLSKTFSR